MQIKIPSARPERRSSCAGSRLTLARSASSRGDEAGGREESHEARRGHDRDLSPHAPVALEVQHSGQRWGYAREEAGVATWGDGHVDHSDRACGKRAAPDIRGIL